MNERLRKILEAAEKSLEEPCDIQDTLEPVKRAGFRFFDRQKKKMIQPGDFSNRKFIHRDERVHPDFYE